MAAQRLSVPSWGLQPLSSGSIPDGRAIFMYMSRISAILKRYGVTTDEDELRQVFTHHSYREDKNNSRYVFLGQNYFKGLLSSYVFKNITGTGMQLQHYLGNICSDKALNSFFDKWKLGYHVRIDVGQKNKIPNTVFVYAFLGYLSEKMNDVEIELFIKEFFIFPNDKFLPGNHKKKNQKEQLIHLCKLHFGQRPYFKTELENDLQKTEVLLNEECIGTHTSVSYKYANKKAIKIALEVIVERIEREIQANPVYKQNEKLRKLKAEKEFQIAKEVRQKKHKERNKDHSVRMSEKRERDKLEAAERDKRRKEAKRLAKLKAEKKKEENTLYREYTIEEIREMSPTKRRNLQDRGIIPKGVFW